MTASDFSENLHIFRRVFFMSRNVLLYAFIKRKQFWKRIVLFLGECNSRQNIFFIYKLEYFFIFSNISFKVSEYPFKQNKNMLKNMTMLLYANFYNIFLNVLRPTFFNIQNLPFLRSPNIGKIRVKVGRKTEYFSYILSSCTNRITVFNNYFLLICSQPINK